MLKLSALLVAALPILLAPADGLAQTPSADSGAAPAIEMSMEQKQTIYQSISRTEKNNPAPPGFRAAVGAHVPDMITLRPMPDTLAGLVPATKSLDVAMVEKQVILVEPRSRAVVAVVTGAP